MSKKTKRTITVPTYGPCLYEERETPYEWLKEKVGGYIERASMPGLRGDLWANEEGLLLGLELNRRASALTATMIVGDAVITGMTEKSYRRAIVLLDAVPATQ